MSAFLLPEIGTWEEWRPLFTDVPTWRPVIERVWAAGEQLRLATGIDKPRHLVAGYPGTCAVFIVDGRAVIKFFPPMITGDFFRESAVYGLIFERVPYSSELLGTGQFKDRIDWPYLVVRHLGGTAWRDCVDAIAPDVQRDILFHLGRTIRAVHDIRIPVSGPWPSMSDWETVTSRSTVSGSELQSKTGLSQQVISEIEGLLAATDWFVGRPCLLHGDLTEDHLLVQRQNGRWRIAGLIDWADSEVGDQNYEWVTLWFSICRRDPVLLRAFMEGYDNGRGAEVISVERLLAFLFLHRFGAVILNDTLTPEQQRGVGTLNELRELLFSGLGA